MSATRTYLDANATEPLLSDARDAMADALLLDANASSTHAAGRAARRCVETARARIAEFAGVPAANVVFTSGATEAANMAMAERMKVAGAERRIARAYVSAVEHPCILAGGRLSETHISSIPVTSHGTIELSALSQQLSDHDPAAGLPLVAVMSANNETGVLQPIKEVSAIAREYSAIFVCDAVQSAGRQNLSEITRLADITIISSHKIGGPQGAGALILHDEETAPAPILTGGGQERSRRAGTENIAALAGFGVAADTVRHHLDNMRQLAALRDEFEGRFLQVTPEADVIGVDANRLPNTSMIVVRGIAAETAVIALDLEGVAVSSGSACSSGKVGPSHVLAAMGYSGESARSGIRFSLPANAARNEIENALGAWKNVYDLLRSRDAA